MYSKKITSLNSDNINLNQKYLTVRDFNNLRLDFIDLKNEYDALSMTSGTIYVDTISEYTSAAGVTIDVGSKFKDGLATLTGQSGGATIKAHAHSCTAEYANEFKGEFLNSSGTMDGIASHYIMQTTGDTGTGVMRSILGVAYLPAGVAITGTLASGSWISGGGFACDIATTATLNGTAVIASGIFAKTSSAIGSNMTSVNHVAAGVFISSLLVKPSAGNASILYLSQEATGTELPQAIYIGGAAYTDAFVTFDAAASGSCIQTAAVDIGGGSHVTSHALHIKIGSADGYIPVWDAANFA